MSFIAKHAFFVHHKRSRYFFSTKHGSPSRVHIDDGVNVSLQASVHCTGDQTLNLRENFPRICERWARVRCGRGGVIREGIAHSLAWKCRKRANVRPECTKYSHQFVMGLQSSKGERFSAIPMPTHDLEGAFSVYVVESLFANRLASFCRR